MADLSTLYILTGTVDKAIIDFDIFIDKIVNYINSCYLQNGANNFIKIDWGGGKDALMNKSTFIKNFSERLVDAVAEEHGFGILSIEAGLN